MARTFRIDARGQKTFEEDLGLSEEDAREQFHRMSGRGLGIKVVDEETGEVLLQDPDADASYASALEEVDRHRRAMGMPALDPASSGWTEQDVFAEAKRIARLPNVAGHLMPPR